MSKDTFTNTPLVRAGYTILGDCFRHTLDVIGRLQGQAEGTPLFSALETLRQEVRAVEAGEGMRAIAAERLHAEPST